MTSRVPEMAAWLARQRSSLEALTGRDVTGWDGIEMALREEGPDGPQFADPAVRFLQLVWVRLSTDAGPARITTYQGDGWFGLHLSEEGWFRAEDADGIYRWRELALPTGRIDAVEVAFEEETLARVTLTIAGHVLLLVAGEVHETRTDALEVHRLDESVLLFTDPADADAVVWL